MITPIATRLYKYLIHHKIDLLIVFTALVSVSLSLLILGTIIRDLVDNGLSPKQLNNINKTILTICSLIFIFILSSFFRAYYINNVSEKIINKIRLQVYEHLLQIPINKFEELKVGDLVSRLSNDLEAIGKLIHNFLSFFIRNLIMLSGALILMFIESAKLSCMVVFIIPLLLLPILKLGKFVRNLSKHNLDSKSDIISNLIETFTNIRTLHAYNQEANNLKQFTFKSDNYLAGVNKRLKIRSLFFAFCFGIILFSITFIIWIGSIDIIKGSMSSGQMISFIYYSIIAASSAGGIAEIFTELNTPIIAANRVFELINLSEDEISPSYHLVSMPPQPFPIDFMDLDFSYPTRLYQKTLQNISFKINQGEFIGIIGKSGSGKSTIFQLLLKFYYPTAGKIKIGNIDLNNISPQTLRSVVAYVPQEAVIFSGTIMSNISFSNPKALLSEIENIAILTGVMDFANLLEKKLYTEIGERGMRLSGGQKQRIALARALLIKPQILLMDEATSAIDAEGEQNLLSEIKKFMKAKTIISITHRISSLEQTDKILALNNGSLTSIPRSEALENYINYIEM